MKMQKKICKVNQNEYSTAQRNPSQKMMGLLMMRNGNIFY